MEIAQNRPECSLASRIIATICLCLATFIFVLDYTIANVAIPYIAGGLATGVDQGTYVITFFAIGNGVVLPMSGWLTKRFGVVMTLTVGVIFFTIFSVACGMSPNLLSLVAFRFLQGAAAGPLVPVSQAILGMIYPKNKVNIIMAIFSMIVLVAPVLGPIIGGWICVNYSWRWIFLINIPFGTVAALGIWFPLKFMNQHDSSEKVDYLSFFLLLIGMLCLQLMLDKGEQWNWFGSIKIRVCFIGAFLSLSYLIFWSFIAKRPLIKLSLLKSRVYAISCILIFVLYGLYMGIVVIIPLWLQESMGYNALLAGIAVSPIGIGAILVAPPLGKLVVPRTGPLPPMILGVIVLALSSVYTRYFYSEVSLAVIMKSRFLVGVGIGCWLVPLMTMPVSAVSDADLSNGLGFFHFLRGVSGGIGTSVFTTIYQRRGIRQHMNVGSHFNDFKVESREYMDAIHDLGIQGKSALALANEQLNVQAAALAINELFWLVAWAFILTIPIILLGYHKRDPSKAHHHVSLE